MEHLHLFRWIENEEQQCRQAILIGKDTGTLGKKWKRLKLRTMPKHTYSAVRSLGRV